MDLSLLVAVFLILRPLSHGAPVTLNNNHKVSRLQHRAGRGDLHFEVVSVVLPRRYRSLTCSSAQVYFAAMFEPLIRKVTCVTLITTKKCSDGAMQLPSPSNHKHCFICCTFCEALGKILHKSVYRLVIDLFTSRLSVHFSRAFRSRLHAHQTRNFCCGFEFRAELCVSGRLGVRQFHVVHLRLC